MNNQTTNPVQARKRKVLLAMPLLLWPFLTLLFWALGGGKDKPQASVASPGLNTQLPLANLGADKPMDKMSYYDKAWLDSQKLQRLINHDPDYVRENISGERAGMGDEIASSDAPTYTGLAPDKHSENGSGPDSHTEQIYRKLAELDKELRQPTQEIAPPTPAAIKPAAPNAADIDRLEQLMAGMQQGNAEDRELQQLNGMLEKIIDIQHPERVQEKFRQNSAAKQEGAFSVSSNDDEDLGTMLGSSGARVPSNHFHSLDGETNSGLSENAFPAMIHETQTLVDGATVRLRLTSAIHINGWNIPRDHILVGTASLNNERLHIRVSRVRHNNMLFPVALQVYDLDGQEGLYIPGTITRDVAKQTADRSLQTVGMTSLDPSWGAQAASAGIEAARTLLGKKIRQVKVTVKGGHRVLLQDSHQSMPLSGMSNHPDK